MSKQIVVLFPTTGTFLANNIGTLAWPRPDTGLAAVNQVESDRSRRGLSQPPLSPDNYGTIGGPRRKTLVQGSPSDRDGRDGQKSQIKM